MMLHGGECVLCAVQVWRLVWNLISYKRVYGSVQFQRNPLVADAKRQVKWAAEYLQRIHYNNTNLIAMVSGPPQPLTRSFLPTPHQS